MIEASVEEIAEFDGLAAEDKAEGVGDGVDEGKAGFPAGADEEGDEEGCVRDSVAAKAFQNGDAGLFAGDVGIAAPTEDCRLEGSWGGGELIREAMEDGEVQVLAGGESLGGADEIRLAIKGGYAELASGEGEGEGFAATAGRGDEDRGLRGELGVDESGFPRVEAREVVVIVPIARGAAIVFGGEWDVRGRGEQAEPDGGMQGAKRGG